MTLLLQLNLGFGWGSAVPPAPTDIAIAWTMPERVLDFTMEERVLDYTMPIRYGDWSVPNRNEDH